MRKLFLVLFILAIAANAQIVGPHRKIFGTGLTAITLEASCTGTGSGSSVTACSAPMTVSAGDLIVVGCYTNNGSFDPSNIIVNDIVNGFYDTVQSSVHPTNSDDWVVVSVMQNSASGSVTPQCNNWEANGMGISAYAFKGTRTTQVLDGATAVNLFKSATGTNPTAGTAGSPTNSNEVIVCMLDLASSTATTAGSGYSPAGTLTAVSNTLAQYSQYQINPAGTVNCNFGTGVSKAYTDTQIAGLNASHSAGYKALTGFYGGPAAAQTNAATASLAILNGTTGTLNTMAPPSAATWWSLLAGTATTFDTGVAPLGTLKLLVDGVAHTVGDAATSLKVPSANTTTAYNWAQKGFVSNGTGMWFGSFFRMGSNATNSTVCDVYNVDANIVEGNFTTQIYYDTTNGINFQFELAQGNIPTVTGMFPSPHLNLAQDYYIITHVAGINEANDDLYILGEATPGVLPWVVIDHFSNPKGGQVIATTTATAGSGASSITVASGTGIVIGQSVFSATTSVDTGQITRGTKVTSVSGTTIGISIPTTASMTATPVEFAGPVARTTGSVTAGSTTLTVASGTGLVSGAANTAQYIGMAGVPSGTYLVSGSGTSWVMSQKATSTQTTVEALFWNPFSGGVPYGVHFGKYSSCNSTADMWFSGMIFDPYGTILPQIASGASSL